MSKYREQQQLGNVAANDHHDAVWLNGLRNDVKGERKEGEGGGAEKRYITKKSRIGSISSPVQQQKVGKCAWSVE